MELSVRREARGSRREGELSCDTAPEAIFNSVALTVWLKPYPDTNPEFLSILLTCYLCEGFAFQSSTKTENDGEGEPSPPDVKRG